MNKVQTFRRVTVPRAAAGKVGEIRIDGPIVNDSAQAGETSAASFWTALQALGKIDRLLLHVNSLGGELAPALAIYRMIGEHSAAEKVARISSVAASAATIIAAACTVEMYPGAQMLIHFTADMPDRYMTATDHEQAAEDCRSWDESMITIYAEKTGKSREEIRAQMESGAWMDTSACMAFGLCDRVLTGPAVTASIDGRCAFAWTIGGKRFDFTGFKSLPTGMLARSDDREFCSIVAAARKNSLRMWRR